MSHITTSSHVGRRAGFDALPQSLSSASNGLSEDDGEPDEHHDNRNRESDYPIYDGRHYGATIQHDEDATPTRYDPIQYSVHTSNTSQLIGDTDIPLSYEKAQSGQPPMLDRDRPNYKPSALRWPFLTSLLVVILALIGLVVYALYTLPVLDMEMGVTSRSLHANRFKREVGTVIGTGTSDSAPDAGITDAIPTSTPSQDDYGNVGTVSVTSETIPVVGTPAPGNYGDVGSKTITEPDTPTTYWSKDSTYYGDVGEVTITETTVPISKATEDFGNVGKVTVTEVDPTYSKPSDDFGDVGLATVTEDRGDGSTVVRITESGPPTPTFVAPAVVTLTDAQGSPTAISTSTPTPVSIPRTTILTDSSGRPTATQLTSELVQPSVAVETDAEGRPTATVTSYPVLPPSSDENANDANTVVTTHYISYGQYFIGMFVPSIVAIALSIPARILDLNARIFQPWHELTHERGAAGRDSLCLQTGGWQAAVTSARSLLVGGQALVFLTTALALASALLIPVAAEAVAVDVRGGCARGGGTARGCAYVLVARGPAAAGALALLGLMALAALLALAFLARWRSGLSTNPWSVCGAASLALNPDVRRLFAGVGADGTDGDADAAMRKVMRDRCFKLGHFPNPDGTWEYGIMLHEDDLGGDTHVLREGDDHDGNGNGNDYDVIPPSEQSMHGRASKKKKKKKSKHHLPFLMLGYTGRLLLLFVLCGLLALILYYNNTGGDTPFERFMGGESFGVRFLFTGVGVVISFFWSSFFDSIAILSPYHLLSGSPQDARRSILLAPPTNAFSGLWSAARRRHGFLAVAALTSILSEFLTVFLSNVPYRVTQTFLVHNVCTWSAVGIICVMILVVAGSFLVRWPRRMPVDPSTIAGAVYYVCDSRMLGAFGGLSALARADRDRRVNDLGLRYGFGEMRGVSGRERVGVDALDGKSYVI